MTKSKIFFWFLIAFILGIAFASFVPPSIPAVWAVFVLGGMMAVFGLLEVNVRQLVSVAGFAVMLFSFGMFWFIRASQPALGLDQFLDNRLTFEGIVDDEPVRAAKSQRLRVREAGSQARLLITTRHYPEYGYGDVLRISGKITRPENFSEDFNYAAYLAKDDIFYTISFPEIEILGHGKGNKLYEFLFLVKDAFSAALNRHLPEPHASFMTGLILGERKSFPATLTEQLQITGTTHLVALSGYNITIVADALLKMLTFFFIPFIWAFPAAVVGIILFTLLTGASASVVRAAIMGILVLVARREGRQYRMLNALTLAAAAMLFSNPKILRFDTAFELSFLATFGLIYVAPVLDRYYGRIKLRLKLLARDAKLIRENRDLRQRSGKKSFLRDTLLSTLAAQFMVLPLLVYNFGRLSLVSPLANLAVVLFVPATMFFGFVTGGLALLGDWLGQLPAAVAWTLLHYELGAISFFAQFPLAALDIPRLGSAVVIGFYLIVAFWLWRKNRSHVKRQ